MNERAVLEDRLSRPHLAKRSPIVESKAPSQIGELRPF